MRYTIRELKLGEILDQAVKLTKDHFGVLYRHHRSLADPFQCDRRIDPGSDDADPAPESDAGADNGVPVAAMARLVTDPPAGRLRHRPDDQRRSRLRDLQCLPRKADQCGRILKRAFQRILPLIGPGFSSAWPSWAARSSASFRESWPHSGSLWQHRWSSSRAWRDRGHEAEQAVNGRQYRDLFRAGALVTDSLTPESASRPP